MRHNKKRNSALLYEFLIRQISNCLVQKDKKGVSKAMAISKKYFSKGAALREELDLFKTLLDTSVKSKISASRILNEVLSGAEKMNSRKLDVEKSKLIKEINYTFNEKFYKHKIPDYKIYASIYTLLNEQRNKKKVLSTVDKIKLEDNILEHLISRNVDKPATPQIDPNYNNAVFKFVVQRFHKKYENRLTERQKRLLTKYAVYLISEDRSVIDSAIKTEVERIEKNLTTIQNVDVIKDKQLMSQLRECYSSLKKIDFSEINEAKILELLKYVKLSEEVES